MSNMAKEKIEAKDLENFDIEVEEGGNFFKTKEDIIKLFNGISPYYFISYIKIGLMRNFKNPQKDDVYEEMFDFPITEESRAKMIELFKNFLHSVEKYDSYILIFNVRFDEKAIKNFGCVIAKKEKDD